MDRLIPKDKSHAVDYVYDNFTEVEQFVFNYILKSFPEFMYYYKEDNKWVYNEPLLSMIAILAKAIGASRELILNLDTSKDINSLYSKIKNGIYTENNKKLLYALATELQYDIGNLDTDIDNVISKLEAEEPFVKNNLVGIRNRGTIEAIRELLMQYSRFEEEYNVQYYAEESGPFSVSVGVNLADLNNSHPLYRALMNIRPAGVVYNIIGLVTEILLANQYSRLVPPIGNNSVLLGIQGLPRPTINEQRNAPIIEANADGSKLRYTIKHNNPAPTKINIWIKWRYNTELSYLDYDYFHTINLPASPNGVEIISSALIEQPNKYSAVAAAQIEAIASLPDGTKASDLVATTHMIVSPAAQPHTPLKPTLDVISINSATKNIVVQYRNTDPSATVELAVRLSMPLIPGFGTITVAQLTAGPGQHGELTINTAGLPEQTQIDLKARASITQLRYSESNTVTIYMEDLETKTEMPSIVGVGCLTTGGSNIMAVTIKNNDNKSADIRIDDMYKGTLGAGATKTYNHISIGETPYSYNIQATAQAPGKDRSATTNHSGTIRYCLAEPEIE